MRTILCGIMLGLLGTLIPLQAADAPLVTQSRPTEPEEAVMTLHSQRGTRVELVAAEPDVVDPVSACFDGSGRLWVVEMPDYPTGPQEGAAPDGRVAILQDINGDGRYERVSTFAEGLLFATGVLPWRDGAIVTLAGSVVFLRDRDGDLVSDETEIWFEGFSEDNTQLRANHPTLAADGRVYVAGGLRGGKVISRDPRWATPQPISLAGRDFAFDIRGGWCGAVVGNSQFGLAISDDGTRFVCDNRHPCRQVVFESEQLDRNPWLTLDDAVKDVAASGADSRVHALTEAWTTSNLHAGQFTAACGLHVRSRGGVPRDFLVCEPTASLVQRQRIESDAIVLESRPLAAVQENEGRAIEWLASTDPWFRPVDVFSGPDQATYIVDMYRAVIEHPQWVPQELKDRPDTWWGNDRGRIWRVVGATVEQPGDAAGDDFVLRLNHPAAAVRQQAVRQFFEAEDPSPYVADLKRAILQHRDSAAAMLAARMLAAADRLDAPLVADLLQSKNSRCVTAVLRSAPPELLTAEQLAEQIDNPEPAVQFAALLAAGLSPDPMTIEAVVERAEAIAANHLLKQACASGSREFVERVLLGILHDTEEDLASAATLAEALARRCGRESDRQVLDALLAALAPDDRRELAIGVVDGVAQGLQRRGQDARDFAMGLSVDARAQVESVLQSVREELAVPNAGADSLQRAVRLIGRYGNEGDRDRLLAILDDRSATALHLACLDALADSDRRAAAGSAVNVLEHLDSGARPRALELIVGDEASALRLLERLAEGSYPRGLLDVRFTSRLQRHSSARVRERADETFGKLNADRRAVIDQYADRIEQGDPQAGRELFRQHCAACHRIGSIGANVGPDISDSRTQSPAALLMAILDPNAAIDAAYLRSSLLTVDGRQLEGLLEENSAERVSLRQTDGTTVVLDPEDIAQSRTTGLSLMPEGFEQQIKPDQMADLIAFIKNWRYIANN